MKALGPKLNYLRMSLTTVVKKFEAFRKLATPIFCMTNCFLNFPKYAVSKE